MMIELNSEDVKKLLGTMNVGEIERKLEANYSYWEVSNEGSLFTLTKKPKEVKS